MSALATQAALIGGFSFTAVSNIYSTEGPTKLTLSYLYYVCFTICLVASLFVLSQATIVVMFGPTMALKGSTDEAVKVAAGHMLQQQILILKGAFIALTAIFFAACFLSWSIYPVGIATICTVVYIIAYYFVLKEGYRAYRIFVPIQDDAFVEPLLDSNMANNGVSYKTIPSEGKDENGGKITQSQALAMAQEATKLKFKGILYKRQSIEDGGLFVKYYAVLEKGRLDLYYREKDYRENNNPINSKPIKLWQFDIEVDHR